MIELARYVYENYPNIKTMAPFSQILSLLDRNEEKVVAIKDEKNFKGAAMYLRITDNSLWKLITGQIKIDNIDDMKNLFEEKGDNIHFIYVLSDSMKTTLRGLKMVIKKERPHSVSWYKPDMSIHILNLRSEICHQ